MASIWYKWIVVVLSSAIKFFGGPLSGLALSLAWADTVICTIAGMMVGVVTVAFGGSYVRKFIKERFGKPKLLFTAKNRTLVRTWKKYGLIGVAFLTPLLLTPIGGTLIAVSFGESVQKICLYMLVAATVWALVITTIVYSVKDWLWH